LALDSGSIARSNEGACQGVAIHLTPEVLERAYELLRETPPFKGWRLPESDDVEFHATHVKAERSADFYHSYDRGKPRGKWVIRIDPRGCQLLGTLLAMLAHEMVHLYQAMKGDRLDVEHGAAFKRLAKQVCAKHGFDPGSF
jgi:hypothetical protein